MSEDRGLLVGAQRIKDFVFGGKAVFTLVSGRTGARFTYRVVRAPGEDDGRPWFVKVLTGSDNDADYRYPGQLPLRHPPGPQGDEPHGA